MHLLISSYLPICCLSSSLLDHQPLRHSKLNKRNEWSTFRTDVIAIETGRGRTIAIYNIYAPGGDLNFDIELKKKAMLHECWGEIDAKSCEQPCAMRVDFLEERRKLGTKLKVGLYLLR